MNFLTMLADLLLATAVFPVLLRHTRPNVVVLGVQGLVLAAIALVYSPNAAGILTACLVIGAKVIVVPGLLHRTAERAAAFELSESATAWSYLGLVGVLFAVRLLTPSVEVGAFEAATSQFISVSLAAMMLGLLVVATRRLLPNQMLGLAMTENGLYGTGLALAHGLPLILDLGVLLDLLLALFLLAWLAGRIRASWGHVDAEQLNGLRG